MPEVSYCDALAKGEFHLGAEQAIELGGDIVVIGRKAAT